VSLQTPFLCACLPFGGGHRGDPLESAIGGSPRDDETPCCEVQGVSGKDHERPAPSLEAAGRFSDAGSVSWLPHHPNACAFPSLIRFGTVAWCRLVHGYSCGAATDLHRFPVHPVALFRWEPQAHWPNGRPIL